VKLSGCAGANTYSHAIPALQEEAAALIAELVLLGPETVALQNKQLLSGAAAARRV
jgi:hypothetical protein